MSRRKLHKAFFGNTGLIMLARLRKMLSIPSPWRCTLCVFAIFCISTFILELYGIIDADVQQSHHHHRLRSRRRYRDVSLGQWKYATDRNERMRQYIDAQTHSLPHAVSSTERGREEEEEEQSVERRRRQQQQQQQRRLVGNNESKRKLTRKRKRFVLHHNDELDIVSEQNRIPKSRNLHAPHFSLEMHWHTDNARDKVCRIHNACIGRDGSLLVHPWLRAKREHLEKCGIDRLVFMKNPSEFNQQHAYAHLDLFGTRPIRYHIPHFLTDVLPFVYASEVIRPEFTSRKGRLSLCLAQGNKKCNPKLVGGGLSSALLIENRVADMNVTAWVPQYISLLQQHPYLAFPKVLFPTPTTRACFRSVIAYHSRSYVREGRQWYGPKNKLFVKNGISRASVLDSIDKSGGKCLIRISILNRRGWVRRGGYLTGRDIVNANAVATSVYQMLKSRRYAGITAPVKVEYFEDKSFDEQIGIVQKADIILGAHGAGLGNIIFARQDTPFVEVMPFGYYAGPFDRLAEALFLPYTSLVSLPDTENFNECIEARAQQMSNPGVAMKGKSLWKEAIKEAKESGNRRVLHAQYLNEPDTTPTKLCVRSQRMRVDPTETARILLENARLLCLGGPGEP